MYLVDSAVTQGENFFAGSHSYSLLQHIAIF